MIEWSAESITTGQRKMQSGVKTQTHAAVLHQGDALFHSTHCHENEHGGNIGHYHISAFGPSQSLRGNKRTSVVKHTRGMPDLDTLCIGSFHVDMVYDMSVLCRRLSSS